ncbi:MAG: hypothetical protein JJU29_01440 [Verrucomicrobia bacterium]|nr:hypothetical protein [Verrucomicrobiota bacterium]MCH8511986.1 hypothetical protein [Kiritimatiellia bacterium]
MLTYKLQNLPPSEIQSRPALRLQRDTPGEILEMRIESGALSPRHWLTMDLFPESENVLVFRICLYAEGVDKPFELHFSALPMCQARLRIPLTACNQQVWRFPRDGALLKPCCYGARLNPRRICKLTLEILRKDTGTALWRQTEPTFLDHEPEPLTEPWLPHGPLVDELGQSLHRNWPGKTQGFDEFQTRLLAQQTLESDFPAEFSRYGGWKDGPRQEATGFFRTTRHQGRWWLVDPDGFLFWSTGLDCVRPSVTSAIEGLKSACQNLPVLRNPYGIYTRDGNRNQIFDHLAWNFLRVFGRAWSQYWRDITSNLMRDWGFNTVANWSDTDLAREAEIPYVITLKPDFSACPMIFRDFPDVFESAFAQAAKDLAEPLLKHSDDPLVIGYFLMNEPLWGFASLLPAEGLLLTSGSSPARDAFANFLEQHPGSGLDADSVRGGKVISKPPLKARDVCEEFSRLMVERYFRILNQAARAAAPHHLNLGIRYFTIPPPWCLEGMRGFDVFSINCYKPRPPADELSAIAAAVGAPVIIGEWHFGALDVGLPGSGIGHVKDQRARGDAYRVYLEQAAAHPDCVGAHYFTLYDESYLGRFDGENWNIGFLDVCNQPYQPMVDAAKETHRRLYEVASGHTPPLDVPIEYLPLLFF